MDKEMDEGKEALKLEMFEWLDNLRESNTINMFGARPYLVEAFGISKAEAGNILVGWMKTFEQRHHEE